MPLPTCSAVGCAAARWGDGSGASPAASACSPTAAAAVDCTWEHSWLAGLSSVQLEVGTHPGVELIQASSGRCWNDDDWWLVMRLLVLPVSPVSTQSSTQPPCACHAVADQLLLLPTCLHDSQRFAGPSCAEAWLPRIHQNRMHMINFNIGELQAEPVGRTGLVAGLQQSRVAWTLQLGLACAA